MDNGIDINEKFSEFSFLCYKGEDEIYVSDKKNPYENGIEIPISELVAFRGVLDKIIKEKGL